MIAGRINAPADNLVFTSGGTEANNLAIFGLLRALAGPAHTNQVHAITTAIEHPAVLQPFRRLERDGVEVTVVSPDRDGLIDVAAIEREIRPKTVLISVMHANNEVGTIQPIQELSTMVRQFRETGRSLYLHSDGVQAFGKVPVDVQDLGVDLYSITAHKVYGPEGAGGLYIRKGTPCEAMQLGGAHERKLRAGTENVPAIAGFAKAVEIANGPGPELRDYFEHELLQVCPEARVNGDSACRLPNTSNVCFPGISGQTFVIALDMKGFAVSSGAACSSGSIEPSPVLLAMGRTDAEARSSVRFSFGRGNNQESVNDLVKAVSQAVSQQRQAAKRNPELVYA